MMAPEFHKRSYEERYKDMGEEAEGEFEKRERNWERFGFDRPDGFELYQIPLTFAATPDYIQVSNSGFPRLVEVMGMGYDEKWKVKFNKIRALQWWDTSELDVWFWIWSRSRQTYADLSYKELMKIINTEDVPVGNFDNDKLFFSIDSKFLHWAGG
tara:strand:- start:10004 stop:10471 length:468 start_codon:yes stop_codon:yes gene_type:complete